MPDQQPLSYINPPPRRVRPLRERVDAYERHIIETEYVLHGRNQTRTAKALGLSRRALIYKLEKHGLKTPPGGAR